MYNERGAFSMNKERGQGSGMNRKYTGEFKQMVVEDLRESKLSLREIGRKYAIDHHRVTLWERIYLEEGPEGLYQERRGRASQVNNPTIGRPPKLDSQVEEDLIAEVQRLRMENAYLKKLNALVQEREKTENKTKLK